MRQSIYQIDAAIRIFDPASTLREKSMTKVLAPLAFLLLLLAGCASTPEVYKVESVYICAAEECDRAAQRYGTDQVLNAVQRLLALNDGQALKFCESDPKSRTCVSDGVCHYVQGGPIPGLGCMKSTSIIAPVLDSEAKRIRFRSNSRGSFIGISASCAEHNTSVSIQSVDEIVWDAEPFYCNWMLVGNSTNTFNFAIDSIDFDRGIVGGYWTHGAGGTGGGIGSGYGVLVLPKGMPRGESWLSVGDRK